MSFLDKLFGKKEEEPAVDPFEDLVLTKMQAGFLVDYDGRTYEVLAHHTHDTGDGFHGDDWELRGDGEMRYLTRVEADGAYWSFTRKVPIGMIQSGLKKHIQDNGDPPEQLEYEGVPYTMQSYGGAKYFRNGKGPEIPYLYWDYEDDERVKVLSIMQWGDIEFEAYVGLNVEEYQFTNILPGKRRS
jgi:hypothetical protein